MPAAAKAGPRPRTTRADLVNDPRSGAKPLQGSPGSGPGRKPPPRRKPAAASQTAVYVQPGSTATKPAPYTQAPAQPAPAAPAQPAPGPARQPGPLQQRFANRSVAGEGSGAVLALLIYPMIINALRGGPAQAKGWVAAKFINQPYKTAAHQTKPGKPTPKNPTPPPPTHGPRP